MKKLLSMAVALFAATTMFAQTADGTFTLQPKFGMTIANSTNDNTSAKVGFIGGVEAGYQFDKHFAFTMGVNYAQYGCKTNIFDYKDNSIDLKYNMNYITVPILANYYVFQGLAIKAGLEPAFKVSATAKVTDLPYDLDEYLPSDVNEDEYLPSNTDNAKAVILSIPVGVSYEYNNIVLDARYNIGITNAIDNISSKNSAFVLTLGYKFTL